VGDDGQRLRPRRKRGRNDAREARAAEEWISKGASDARSALSDRRLCEQLISEQDLDIVNTCPTLGGGVNHPTADWERCASGDGRTEFGLINEALIGVVARGSGGSGPITAGQSLAVRNAQGSAQNRNNNAERGGPQSAPPSVHGQDASSSGPKRTATTPKPR